ncbi:MAG: xylulose kinase, partial [Chloroflexi bacterium]|nr:xylulose kinase [Chloroflexota bacterium]
MGEYLIGIDCSTQSTKAVAWDLQGRAIAEGRAPLRVSHPAPGWAEQDPAEWWESTAAAL